jgi:hypothetical protein
MSERRDELIDEAVLRRALRLDGDERGPRFDAAAIATLAAAGPSRRAFTVAAGATVLTGVVAAAVWSVAGDAAPILVDALVELGLSAIVAVATVLAPIAEIAAEPAVPLSLLAALGIAILHELRERREYAHANAS